MAQNTIEQMDIQLYDQIEPNESFQKDFKSGVRNVGQFSEDSAGNLILNPVTTSVLKDDFVPDSKTKIKKVNFNLNIAIKRAQTYSDDLNEKRFENFLKWIAENSEVFSKLATLNTDRSGETFVTKSDVISKILLTPYIDDSWSFYATYIRGAVYMMSFRKDFCVRGGDLSYNRGHKFKQYMCGGNITEGICPNEQYRIVLTSKLGSYDMLYHKRIDCVKSGTISGQKKLSDYVNLYQTTCTDKPDPTNYFERVKAFEWVVPMVMGGVDETIVGFTNKKKGLVKEVRLYTENDLKEKGKGHWNLDKNFTFAVDFLKFVKEKTKSIPGEVLIFQRKNQNIVTCLKGEKKFVPDWFVKMLETSGVKMLETSGVKMLETSGVEKLETSVVEEMETSDLDF